MVYSIVFKAPVAGSTRFIFAVPVPAAFTSAVSLTRASPPACLIYIASHTISVVNPYQASPLSDTEVKKSGVITSGFLKFLSAVLMACII